MQFKDFTKEEINEIYSNIDKYLETKEIKWTKYIDLGCKVVKLVSYSDEFLPLVEKQLTFALKDNSETFDDTLIIWNEKDVLSLTKNIISKFPKMEIKLRFEKAFRKAHRMDIVDEEVYSTQIFDKNFSKTKPAIEMLVSMGLFIGKNKESHTYYYGVNNLEPEEFIKQGHIFVQIFNDILKTKTSNLVHGAVIGYNGKGICICARGQRGKSTLSVLSMIKGFEYVSDDYLILHQNDKEELLSSPIYSIITLSPEMYNRLYGYLHGSQFVSNNARKDKYVFNISNYHNTFRRNYPIKLCIFPEIVTDKEPSIRPCTKEEKGRAITNLIQSTLMQTQDLNEHETVIKLYKMVTNFPFYKFNLCHDIDKNTEFLKNFMKNFDYDSKEIISDDRIFVDITFDIANILDNTTGTIYTMNKFSTNLYENLLNGVSISEIKEYLLNILPNNEDIMHEFDLFTDIIVEKKFLINKKINTQSAIALNCDFAVEDDYRLSIIEYKDNEDKDLIKENKDDKLCIK